MTADASSMPLSRAHSWPRAAFIFCSLSCCITVDILQYSMPLAFLPSVLEDRGHSTMKIATAIGIYYWTGFAGGCIITSYQVYRVIRGDGLSKDSEEHCTTVRMARRQIWYLVAGLMLGTVTLFWQAMEPTYQTHTTCRFIQGMAGAFIFFYTFLLSVELFKGQQQVYAMTAASTALNVAEVLGSFFGAWIFDRHGESAVFWFLGVASLLNQFLLIAVIIILRGEPSAAAKPTVSDAQASTDSLAVDGWQRLRSMLRSRRLHCAVILIAMSAVVKGSIEEILPFHADHQWGLDPLGIGLLFSAIACAYISAAFLTGQIWQYLQGYHVIFSAFWLSALGVSAWCVLAVASYQKRMSTLYGSLIFYGICLGLTHTPAALLLADAVEHEDGACKDAVNGIWNTMWEAGGSLGFLLGGLLAHNYTSQLELTAVYTVVCIIAAGVLLLAAPSQSGSQPSTKSKLNETDLCYGSTTANDF